METMGCTAQPKGEEVTGRIGRSEYQGLLRNLL
jgi:hypothetical protein